MPLDGRPPSRPPSAAPPIRANHARPPAPANPRPPAQSIVFEASSGNGDLKDEDDADDAETVKQASGLAKPAILSAGLAQLLNVPDRRLPRTQVIKKMWQYIRSENLQDPSDKRKVRCDGPLYELFKVKTCTIFNMNKYLSKHLYSESEVLEYGGGEDDASGEPAAKKAKVEGGAKVSGFQQMLELSPGLSDMLGVDRVRRSDLTKKIWEYIKSRNLQDPANKRHILWDAQAQAAFRVEACDMFKMQRLLIAHSRTEGSDEPFADPEETAAIVKALQAAPPAPASKKKKKKRKVKRNKNAELKGPMCDLSAELGAVLGRREMKRTEVVKELWAYIRAKELQDPADRRQIVCDPNLQRVFGLPRVSMFQMNKLLCPHIVTRIKGASTAPKTEDAATAQAVAEDTGPVKGEGMEAAAAVAGGAAPAAALDMAI